MDSKSLFNLSKLRIAVVKHRWMYRFRICMWSIFADTIADYIATLLYVYIYVYRHSEIMRGNSKLLYKFSSIDISILKKRKRYLFLLVSVSFLFSFFVFFFFKRCGFYIIISNTYCDICFFFIKLSIFSVIT